VFEFHEAGTNVPKHVAAVKDYTVVYVVVVVIVIIIIIILAFTTHLRVLASSFLMFQDHTQRHNTVGRTPLDE
jgi:amino acid transporter